MELQIQVFLSINNQTQIKIKEVIVTSDNYGNCDNNDGNNNLNGDNNNDKNESTDSNDDNTNDNNDNDNRHLNETVIVTQP